MLVQEPSAIHVGRVTAVYWDGDSGLATLAAEFADQAGPWPGIPETPERRIRIILTRDAARFDSLTRGRLPEWGAGAAFPASNSILVKVGGDPRAVQRLLRHELAHLALHEKVRRVPRWLDEGYAARAAGEWTASDALAVNWAVLWGRRPTLAELDRQLQSASVSEATSAYAFSTTAVLMLERIGGERGLAPLLTTLESTVDFDAALRTTHQLTLRQFEERWHKELRSRYGWMLLGGSLTLFWALAGLILVSLWSRRRLRDDERRMALEEGWELPREVWENAGGTPNADA